MPRDAMPPRELVELTDRLARKSGVFHIREHPYILKTGACGQEEMRDALDALSGELWPCVWLHGDLAPWNCLMSTDGHLRLIDWEYAEEFGLPHVDLAYYALQVSYFVRRADPHQALRLATAALEPRTSTRLVAEALTRVACYGAYTQEI
ncbi:MAG: phosphotransferase, partial [Coriobacteriia bacterium]|nr:phosphotransferase [Coriobacteriia bacterium]